MQKKIQKYLTALQQRIINSKETEIRQTFSCMPVKTKNFKKLFTSTWNEIAASVDMCLVRQSF